MIDFDENDKVYPYLYKTIMGENKEELGLVMFSNLQITFDELFDIPEF